MHAEIDHGLGAARGLGIVTPYAGIGLAQQGARSWRMGTQWQFAPNASVSIEGAWRAAAIDDGPEHQLMLRGTSRW
ncbi:MAG: hypothetical protein OXC11_02410 [Rhodospirillales bacterium]|nr:hypothetical protein [Rhodospirillales bacterium]